MEYFVKYIVGSIVVSAVLAWFVWLIAKRAHLGWGFWLLWVLATTVGWYSGSIVGFFGGEVVEAILPNYGDAALLAVVGAGVGILQWLVLLGRVSRAGWWVLASTVGWAVSMAVLGLAARQGPMGLLALAVGLAGSGVGQGAVTGLALVWLLQQPAKQA